MFLNDDKVVFSLFIILFRFSRNTFCSYDSFSLGLLCRELFGCVAFPFSKVGSSFLFDCFCLRTLYLSSTVLLYCLFVFWCISNISRSENQTFFNIVPTWSACCLKTSTFLLDLNRSFPRSSLWRVVPKIAMQFMLIVFQVHVLRFVLWLLWFLKSSFVYLKKEQPTFAVWGKDLLSRLSEEHLPIMTPKPVAWVPCCVISCSIFSSCSYTRPTGCLLSACRKQMCSRKVMVTVSEQ